MSKKSIHVNPVVRGKLNWLTIYIILKVAAACMDDIIIMAIDHNF